MRRTVLAVALAALVAAAAGCGGSGKSAATTQTTTTSTTAKTSTSTTTATTTPKLSFSSTKNCSRLASLEQKAESSLNPASGSATLATLPTVLKSLADAAPSAIKGDLETVAGAFSAYVEGLKSSGYKTGQIPTAAQIAALTKAAKQFQTPKVKAAITHLTSWVKTNCGALMPTTTG